MATDPILEYRAMLALDGVPYPVRKAALVRRLQGRNVDPEVVRLVWSLPGREFRTPADLRAALRAVDRTGTWVR